MIGWLDSLLSFDDYSDSFDEYGMRVKAMNRAPVAIDRGLSEAMSLRSSQLDSE